MAYIYMGIMGGMILQVAGESSRKKCLDPEFHLTKLADMLPKDSSVRDDEIETGNPTNTKRLEDKPFLFNWSLFRGKLLNFGGAR